VKLWVLFEIIGNRFHRNYYKQSMPFDIYFYTYST